jgi:hypothetical protein
MEFVPIPKRIIVTAVLVDTLVLLDRPAQTELAQPPALLRMLPATEIA